MNRISVQVSLYPLRQEAISSAIGEALRVFRGYELMIQAGEMSTILRGEEDVVFSAVQEAFHQTSGSSDIVMVATFSNACPEPKVQ